MRATPRDFAPGDGAHWKSIDSLRGLAASAVVFYHLWNRFWPGVTTQNSVLVPRDHHEVSFWLTAIFGYGYLGVPLFFVLSGFCIHMPQALDNCRGRDRFSLRQFAVKRVRRLYPAYLASVFLTSACLAVFPLALFIAKKHPIDIAAAFGLRDVLASASFLQQLYPESLRFNGVYWTLVYEAGFYVCYPLLRQVTARWGMIPVATALFASEVILLFHPVPIPLFVLNKYFEWYLGFIAAEIFVRKTEPPSAVLKIGTLAFFALGFLSTMNARLYAFRDVIFCVAFFGLLLIVLNVSAEKARSRLHRVLMGVLENPLPVLIGSFSYSLYLIHVPLIDVIWQGTALAAKYGVVGSLTGKLILIGCVPALFPLAYIFYCRFERPFLRRAPG